MSPTIAITGALGFLGSGLLRRLISQAGPDAFCQAPILALDVREPDPSLITPGIQHQHWDVRQPGLAELLREHGVDVVIHLAAIVTPGPGMSQDLQYGVDVLGTRNVIDACVSAGVRRLIVTSSGAAYGYHPDNPPAFVESDPLRGNDIFPYARHKRLVEEMLAGARQAHPELEQVILRVCTILGTRVDNQITRLFEARRPLGLRGSATPYSFVWDEDVIDTILTCCTHPEHGIFNLAGDGTVTLDEAAAIMGKRVLRLPPALVRGALRLLKPLGLVAYGPEQLGFIQHRPVLDNTRLRRRLGITLGYTSRQAFQAFWRHRQGLPLPTRRFHSLPALAVVS